MKKVLIITTNYNCDYDVRVKYLEAFLNKKGVAYLILASNFDHRRKVKYDVKRPSVVQLEVPEYQRNLSVDRIISHYSFAKKAADYCRVYQPDIIYAITPPNFLFHFLKKYKQKHDVRLIFEIMDLWPESLPFGCTVKKLIKPATAIWARIRNRNINAADFLVYECDLYRKYLRNRVRVPGKTVYLTKDKVDSAERNLPFDGMLRYVYLGSVNNIIDIDMILRILELSARQIPTELHIIGGGENTEVLLKGCQEKSIPVINHGIIFENKKKEEILSQCHLALNIMKPTVFVGATMKSLEYFHYGVPVVNNIKGDTAEIIEADYCGLNVSDEQQIEADLIVFLAGLDTEKLKTMSENAKGVYARYFSPAVFEKAISEIFESFE